MERKRQLLLLWAALVIPAISAVSFEDQKNFFYHDPNTNTPPTGKFHSISKMDISWLVM